MNNVVWLSLKEGTPPTGYWDQTLLKIFFTGSNHYYSTDGLDEATVIIPGAYQGDIISDINYELSKLKKCTVIVTSDEENNFNLDKLKHPRMKVYATYPNKKFKREVHWLPIGPAQIINEQLPNKTYDWFFAGQVNHESRIECVEVLSNMENGFLKPTEGFAQGLKHDEYYLQMSKAKVVPSPKGNISPDSFRLYEALELGCVPIPEDKEFWKLLFNDPKFPILDSYEQLEGYIKDAVEQYPVNNNELHAWWQRYKRDLRIELAGTNEDVTVIVPCSSIPSHPDTTIIEETLDSIRHHLPTADIILTFDGIRKEHRSREEEYNEFIRRCLWLCNFKYKNVYPMIFKKHTHQVGMARESLKHVNTPLIMYVEQDTPLVTDYKIEFEDIFRYLKTGDSNMIRFHFEASIPKEHDHMIHGYEPIKETPLKLLRTSQWSQRPHVATKAFYDRILRDHFSENAKSFIEDMMHGIVAEAYITEGTLGWHQFRVHIYAPDGNIKRSYHTDGRAGEAKYDDTQIF